MDDSAIRERYPQPVYIALRCHSGDRGKEVREVGVGSSEIGHQRGAGFDWKILQAIGGSKRQAVAASHGGKRLLRLRAPAPLQVPLTTN